jgi:hypothetical protein
MINRPVLFGVVFGLALGLATSARGQSFHFRACGYCPPWMHETECCRWRYGPMPGQRYDVPPGRSRWGTPRYHEQFRQRWRDENWPGAW